MTEQPNTAASKEALDWIARVEVVEDPAGNTIYDEMRRNFLPRIEVEARQQDSSALRTALDCGCDWDSRNTAGCPHALPPSAPLERPHIVCLCGSTRFAEQMNKEAELLTLGGCIVVRPEVVAYSRERDQQFVAPEVKAALDELHLRKIDLADSVLVVNVGDYTGESTRREIAYAERTGKPVEYAYARRQVLAR